MVRFVFMVALAISAFASPALAAETSPPVLPWGDWLASALDYLLPAVGAVALALFARVLAVLPAPVAEAIHMLRVEQLLARAVDYGISATAGAAKGRTLTIDTGAKVLNEAIGYAIDAAPGIVAKIGEVARLQEMILARLELDPDVDRARLLRAAGRPVR